jgi:hypothetical protein
MIIEGNYNSEDALNSRKLSIHTKRNESVHNLEMQVIIKLNLFMKEDFVKEKLENR